VSVRRYLHGLDEMAIETAFIGVSALVFIVVVAYALQTSAARSLEGVPVLGAAIGGARALVGQVANS
jgi:hypothetical protein